MNVITIIIIIQQQKCLIIFMMSKKSITHPRVTNTIVLVFNPFYDSNIPKIILNL